MPQTPSEYNKKTSVTVDVFYWDSVEVRETEIWRRRPRRPIMSRARAVTVLGLWKTHRDHTGDLELTEAEVLVALSECLAAGCSAGHGYTLHDYYEAYRVLSNFVKTYKRRRKTDVYVT